MGAALQQFVEGMLVPLAFFSQKLRPPKRKYSAFDHELLALNLGIHNFRYFLKGQQFIPFTDHKSLTFCMSKPPNCGWPASNSSCRIYQNLQPTFTMYMEKITSSWTRCPEPSSQTFIWASTSLTWLQPNSKIQRSKHTEQQLASN